MKKLLLIGVALVMTACSSTNFVAHKISETPKTTRQALIFEDHVVIVTKTKLTLDEYNRIVAVSVQNREERH
jgi:ABC-type Fe3+-hydroxamate transport system substrate-binding protein